MKADLRTASILAVAVLLVPIFLEASWFSDLTGVNIDPWHGKFEVGIPQPGKAIQQLPDQIRQLPQTIANLFNPGGLALAAAIRNAEQQASYGAQPVPPSVYQQLIHFYFPDFLQSVRYNTFGHSQITLSNAIILLNKDVVAVTVNDIIVFRDESRALNPVIWAHELTHVQQYRYMGIDTFANVYITQAWILENQAIDQQSRIAQQIYGGQPMQGP